MSRVSGQVFGVPILLGLLFAGNKLLPCLRGRAKRAASAISIAREWVHEVGVAKRRRGGRVFGIAILSLLLLKVPNIFAQSMRLQDAPLGSVVQIGSFNYIKVAENKYMQSAQVACPDSATVGGMYVKCFKDKSAYESACSGSGSCNCQYEEAGTVTTKSGAYTVYNYICDVPCYSPNAHYNDDKSKCICDEDGYSYVHVSNASGEGYACVPLSNYEEYTKGIDFDYTGDIQTFTAPFDGTYKLEVWGAQGGSAYGTITYIGGFGGFSFGNVKLSAGEVLYVVVGGRGENETQCSSSQSKGGYNGGGIGASSTCPWSAGGGGGATHIASIGGVLSTLSTMQSAIYIVAGGGGGGALGSGSTYYGIGGNGGGYNGSSGTGSAKPGAGGTQNSGCSFGLGCYGGSSSGGGGGGGWYGGNGATDTGDGGGGSGYIGGTLSGTRGMYCYKCTTSSDDATKTNSTTATGHAEANKANTGNGYARITLISVD